MKTPLDREEKSLHWEDSDLSGEQPSPYEPTYRDGSVKNECWNSNEPGHGIPFRKKPAEKPHP